MKGNECPVCHKIARDIWAKKDYTIYRCANGGACDSLRWEDHKGTRKLDVATLHIFLLLSSPEVCRR